ncbi:hypothetical protein QBC47DRAFT_443873 [Echria macrotheca]|uniref:Uncharacterized protein n=1 Tax=Echria macrotheca TaxID=438768 RepID=A0AAJ0BF13_9PEZI|nr:hypothetical protein QBC47DRAFT_443873 [Echria macrotheca]
MHFFTLIPAILASAVLAAPSAGTLDTKRALDARTIDPPVCIAACTLACHFDPVCSATCILVCSATVEPGNGVTNAELVDGEWKFETVPLPAGSGAA